MDISTNNLAMARELGTGVAAKIAQVTLCYTPTAALIEALLLGVKLGVKPEMMLDKCR